MDRIEFENFRVFKNRTVFDLAPITILTGTNNAGKSTLLKGLMLLSDYLNSRDQTEIKFDGEFQSRHKINSVTNLLNWKSKSNKLSIGFSDNGEDYSFEFACERTSDFVYLKNFSWRNEGKNFRLILKQLSTDHFSISTSLSFLKQFIYNFTGVEDNLQKLLSDKKQLQRQLKETKKEQSSVAPSESRRKTTIATSQQLQLRLKLLNGQIKRLKSNKLSIDSTIEIDFNGLQLSFVKDIADIIKFHLKEKDEKLYQELIEANVFDHLKDKFDFGFNLHHLTPYRFYQSRVYHRDILSNDINAIVNSYTREKPFKGSEEQQFLSRWLERFGLGYDVEVRSFDGEAASIFLLSKDSDQPINISDKGFGSGQILTILFEIIVAISRTYSKGEDGKLFSMPTILIEEPEANLHPKYQSLLAELSWEANKLFRVKFILETHSEYLVRKIQTIIKERATKGIFRIYYFDSNTGMREMRISDDGKLLDEFGSGFFDEARNLAFEIL